MAAPLHVLASQDKLPLHQYLDEATLEWIEQNNPFTVRYIADSSSQDERNKLIADMVKAVEDTISWYSSIQILYARTNAANTLHGDLHALRVAFFSALLSIGNTNIQPSQAVLAGLYHDVARVNDQADLSHGVRSAAVLENYLSKSSISLSPEETERMIMAVRLHDDSNLEGLDDLRAVLKVADALDRYRLPKTKWWPDESKMPFTPPAIVFYVAYKLVLNSEAKVLEGEGFVNALRDSVAAIIQELTQ